MRVRARCSGRGFTRVCPCTNHLTRQRRSAVSHSGHAPARPGANPAAAGAPRSRTALPGRAQAAGRGSGPRAAAPARYLPRLQRQVPAPPRTGNAGRARGGCCAPVTEGTAHLPQTRAPTQGRVPPRGWAEDARENSAHLQAGPPPPDPPQLPPLPPFAPPGTARAKRQQPHSPRPDST